MKTFSKVLSLAGIWQHTTWAFSLPPPTCTHIHTHLLCQFTVLIDVSHLVTAEVCGGLRAGAAEHGNLGVAAVVVAVAGGGLALVHGVVLGRPLQRREALDVSRGNPTEPWMSQNMKQKHLSCWGWRWDKETGGVRYFLRRLKTVVRELQFIVIVQNKWRHKYKIIFAQQDAQKNYFNCEMLLFISRYRSLFDYVISFLDTTLRTAFVIFSTQSHVMIIWKNSQSYITFSFTQL